MKFENTPKSDGGSYEKPKPGKYLGLLAGFAYVGTQGGGQYGPKPKVMLRWELHKRKGPSLDSKGFIHTVTATYGATVRGESSLLRKCLEAHGVNLPEGTETDSHDWLGHGAWLDLDESPDHKYINVVGVSKLDPDDDELPEKQLHFEHWEGDDGSAPPSWANWAVARSTDLAHLASEKKPAVNGQTAPVAVTAGAGGIEDDIPF